MVAGRGSGNDNDVKAKSHHHHREFFSHVEPSALFLLIAGGLSD